MHMDGRLGYLVLPSSSTDCLASCTRCPGAEAPKDLGLGNTIPLLYLALHGDQARQPPFRLFTPHPPDS